MKTLSLGGKPLRVGGQLSSHKEWAEILPWTHSWDAADAVLYVPSASEQSAFSINALPRIASIPDRGSGGRPLVKDAGAFGVPTGSPANIPGPLPIASSARFGGRPAWRHDRVSTGFYGDYSLLSACIDPWNSATWFNPPNGYAVPYLVAQLYCLSDAPPGSVAAALDSIRGDIGTGPTHHASNQGGGATTHWTVSCWSGNSPGAIIDSGHDSSVNETVLLLTSVASGAGASSFGVYWRDEGGVFRSVSPTGTLTEEPYLETFCGWVHSGYYSAVGIKLGTPTLSDLLAVINWSTPHLTPRGASSAEPVTEVFFDDWETGDNSKWVTVTGAPPVSGASALTGSNGVRLSPALSDKSLGTSTTKWTQSGRPYFSFVGRFRMNALPAGGTTASLFTIQNVLQATNVDLFIEQASGRLYADLQGPVEIIDTGITPVVGQWYTVQMKGYFGSSTYWLDLKINGIQFNRLLSLGRTATSTRALRMGPVGLTNQTWEADFDDVKIVVDNVAQGWIT